MCTVSNIGDHFNRQWQQYTTQPSIFPYATREEVAALRAEVLEMKRLLANAKEIDTVTGQPDCGMDEKVALLRKVAELVGVDLEDIL